MPLDTLLARDLHRVRPIASITPSGVAISTVDAPSVRLFCSAWSRLESSPTDPSAQQYHCVEKPCQTLRERPSLNENCTATRTGTSDHTMYAQVMPASAYGRRQGLRHGGTRLDCAAGCAAVRGASATVIGRPCSIAGSGSGSSP